MAERTGSRRDQSPRSTFARFLAPLLLLAAVVVVVFVVSSSTGGGGGDGGGAAKVGGDRSAKKDASSSIPDSYVIQPGDSLSQIADQFGLTVDDLERLNRDIDPQALATGQRLKLR